jgi:hypothetical protein
MPGLPTAGDDAAPQTGTHAEKRGQLSCHQRWNNPIDNKRFNPMKIKTVPFLLILLFLILTIAILTSCSLSASDTVEESNDLDITQAYQTVDAQLTQAVAQTPVPPTKTVELTTATATPTPEEAIQPTATTNSSEPTATFMPTFTHTPATRCDKADAAYPSIDITIPDDTTIPAGNSFTKVWRLVNTGTCNWTAAYRVVFVNGEQMDAPDSVAIDQPVSPGQSIDIDITMIAPEDTGTYQGNWMLRNADGELFGIGPNANDSFWVRIVVVEPDDTATPTTSPVPDPDVLVSGSVTLSADETIDLDTLQVNTTGSDLVYQQISDGSVISGHQLVTLSGVTVGSYGQGRPNYNGCKTTNIGSATIDLQATAAGSYFCYKTDIGLTGWARLDDLDEQNGVVTITILTWTPEQ